MAIMSKPKKTVTFPPPGPKHAHRVKDGDNWWSLQSQYGFADVWDLIRFNFGTEKPSEVNWCLKHFVGCVKETKDKKNFCFSSKANPGVIYIPAKNVKSGGGGGGTCDESPLDPAEQARMDSLAVRSVNSALTMPAIGWLTIPWEGFTLTPADLQKVRTFVANDWIHVRYQHSLCGRAEYNVDDDTIYLGQGFAPCTNLQQQALVVHECVHAAMDIKNPHGLANVHSEGVAYVAQMMFLRKMDVSRKNAVQSGGDFWLEMILDTAWDIGLAIFDNRLDLANHLRWTRLVGAIKSHPLYREELGSPDAPADYNGIRKAPPEAAGLLNM